MAQNVKNCCSCNTHAHSPLHIEKETHSICCCDVGMCYCQVMQVLRVHYQQL